jgi:hypothetical protein
MTNLFNVYCIIFSIFLHNTQQNTNKEVENYFLNVIKTRKDIIDYDIEVHIHDKTFSYTNSSTKEKMTVMRYFKKGSKKLYEQKTYDQNDVLIEHRINCNVLPNKKGIVSCEKVNDVITYYTSKENIEACFPGPLTAGLHVYPFQCYYKTEDLDSCMGFDNTQFNGIKSITVDGIKTISAKSILHKFEIEYKFDLQGRIFSISNNCNNPVPGINIYRIVNTYLPGNSTCFPSSIQVNNDMLVQSQKVDQKIVLTKILINSKSIDDSFITPDLVGLKIGKTYACEVQTRIMNFLEFDGKDFVTPGSVKKNTIKEELSAPEIPLQTPRYTGWYWYAGFFMVILSIVLIYFASKGKAIS